MDNAVHSAHGQTALSIANNTILDDTASKSFQSLIDNLQYINNTASQPSLLDFIAFGRANHDALMAYFTRNFHPQSGNSVNGHAY